MLRHDLFVGAVFLLGAALIGFALDNRIADRQIELEQSAAAREIALENMRFVRQTVLQDGIRPFRGLDLDGMQLTGLPMRCHDEWFVTDQAGDSELVGEVVLDGDDESSEPESNPFEENFECLDLSDASLVEADLAFSDLTEAGLTYADLSDAALSFAIFEDAHLYKAVLDGAFGVNVNFDSGWLSSASLVGAWFSNSSFQHAYFRNADLREAEFSCSRIGEPGCADFLRADLSGADLRGADFSEADLTGVDLADVCYDEATIWPNGVDEMTSVPTSSAAASCNELE
jgi:uncharacterized protein YjbI with pentapeptide repeats